MAEAYHPMISAHMYSVPIGTSATVQINACSCSFVVQKLNQGPLHKPISNVPSGFEEVFVKSATGPRTEIELDLDVARSHLPTEKTLGGRILPYSKLK